MLLYVFVWLGVIKCYIPMVCVIIEWKVHAYWNGTLVVRNDSSPRWLCVRCAFRNPRDRSHSFPACDTRGFLTGENLLPGVRCLLFCTQPPLCNLCMRVVQGKYAQFQEMPPVLRFCLLTVDGHVVASAAYYSVTAQLNCWSVVHFLAFRVI
jgi:hypothetical protein